ncbi:biotin--[acetyl-CoA-carboxylase] ligase [uncultured Senegalimassilia sp.]|uniref:biotin--[acetyl-CoA-carboxylase] ligase n=1 Tax=uncultured Senegalimassilia sp. TaxID=1714350 RepID=UPI0027DB13FB|nr:biotin--[acetyl-CoA-carboxylase] ligase [uncultured Senegalimassilia sp.]
MQFRVESFETVTSTNDLIKRAIEEGQPEGLAVRGLRQTAGYGRQGRAWESPIGGMYQSFLLRPDVPPAQLPTLSLLVGLAVRRAIASLVPELEDRVQVKWPNDIVVAEACDSLRDAAQATGEGFPCRKESASLCGAASHGAARDDAAPGDGFSDGDRRPRRPFHKLCGISTEMHARALCVGVGINVARPADAASAPAGKNIPVYLDELGFCEGPVEDRINAVADALCGQLAIVYPLWCEQGFEPFQVEFDACSALSGRFVRMEDLSGNVLTAGTVTRVATDGRLVLRTPEGVEVFASSGEAHIR